MFAVDSLSEFEVEVSEDPGRYVCNWLYYLSLKESEKYRQSGVVVYSLFVHVPSFEYIPEERQLQFVHALFRELAGWFESGGGV